MEKFLDETFTLLKKQGLSFVLLAAAVWYFHSEMQILKQQLSHCQQILLECYKK